MTALGCGEQRLGPLTSSEGVATTSELTLLELQGEYIMASMYDDSAFLFTSHKSEFSARMTWNVPVLSKLC